MCASVQEKQRGQKRCSRNCCHDVNRVRTIKKKKKKPKRINHVNDDSSTKAVTSQMLFGVESNVF